jgi:hypothetical protein
MAEQRGGALAGGIIGQAVGGFGILARCLASAFNMSAGRGEQRRLGVRIGDNVLKMAGLDQIRDPVSALGHLLKTASVRTFPVGVRRDL